LTGTKDCASHLLHQQALFSADFTRSSRIPFIDRQDRRVGPAGPHRTVLGADALRHLTNVFGLIPQLPLSAWIEAVDRGIAARMRHWSWRSHEGSTHNVHGMVVT
jgi:hypothetical protein